MKSIKTIFGEVIGFCILFLTIFMGISFAEPGIKIVEPRDGAIVHPGEEITLRIETVEGFVVTNGQVMVNFFFKQFTSLPASFTIKIPIDAAGTINIFVMAGSTPDKCASDEVNLKVQQTATLQSLEIDQDKIFVDLSWEGNIKEEDRLGRMTAIVYGIYSDGVARNLSDDLNTTYVSSDPSVVSIDNKGNYQIHKAGEAKITVSNSGVGKDILLVFIKPTGIRPSETISPITAIDIKPPANSAGWYNTDITVTLTAKDNKGGSGIREIDYSFLGTKIQNKYVEADIAVIPFSIEGIKELVYSSIDKEGNYEKNNRFDIKLDKTPPQLSLTSPKENTEYFHDEAIPLTYTSTDALSGINSTLVSLDNTGIANSTSIQPKVGSHTLVLTATDKADNKATIQASFVVKLKADITIKPEVFLSDKGIFLAIVRFPSGYDHRAITDAVCDGAQAKKVIKARKSAIIVFRKEDITQKPIDTVLNLRGHFAKGLIFEGTDTIRKVTQKKGPLESKKDKEDEDAEINTAIDELLKDDKGELKRIKKEIGEI